MLYRRFHLVLLLLVFSLLSVPATHQPAQAMSASVASATAPAQTINAASDSIELVGSYGGVFKGLAANGTWLYAAHNGGFAVFDTSDPNQPVRRGHILLPNQPRVADYANGIIYVATPLDLYAIDVTDPDQPTIRARYSLSSAVLTDPRDIRVVDGRLYLLYYESGVDDDANNLAIFDVSTPERLDRLGVYDDTLWPDIGELEVVGSFAYITRGGRGLTIVNASDPSNPTLHSSTTAFGRLFDIDAEGDRLYIASLDNSSPVEHLLIFDVSNPGSPVLIDTYTAPNFVIADLRVQDDRVYVANSKFTSPHELRILDVSDPANVTQLGSYTIDPNRTYELLVAGNQVYFHIDAHLVQIVDVSNPASPTARGQIVSPTSADEVEVVGSTAYVAGRGNGLTIIDVSDPAQPRLRSIFGGSPGNTPNSALDVHVVGNLAYIAAGTSFKIVDVSNPDAPTLRAELTLRVYELQIIGNRAYLISDDTFSIINISDPSNPTVIVTHNLTQYGQGFDIQILGNRLYVAEGSCAEGCKGSVQIFDISNEASPVMRGSVNGPFGDIEIVGNLLYILSNYYLSIYDVTNPASPTLRHTWTTRTSPEELEIVGQYAYFAGGFRGGFQIADLSVPTSPKLRATFTTSSGSFGGRSTAGVKVVNDLVYVADDFNGLFIFRIDPAQFPSSIFAPIVSQ